jgi:hypothetical protein
VSLTHSQSREFAPACGPFSLHDEPAYRRWRARKLRRYPRSVQELRVPIAGLDSVSAAQRDKLTAACGRANFAIYQTDPQNLPHMAGLRAFGERLGLVHFDRHLWAPQGGIVALRKETGGGRSGYIPYTDRAMRWHTDGYYNTADAAVRGVIMHCVSPAAAGGGNWLLDPEMVYIAMRDVNPAYIEALMQPDVMTIPENTLEPGAHRPAVSGPVFAVESADQTLHMRYTARTRSIRWKDDAGTRDAVAFLAGLLTPPVSFAFHVCLKAGEGIVCNNVLHAREAFDDAPDGKRQRLLWRARYRDRITAGNVPRGSA